MNGSLKAIEIAPRPLGQTRRYCRHRCEPLFRNDRRQALLRSHRREEVERVLEPQGGHHVTSVATGFAMLLENRVGKATDDRRPTLRPRSGQAMDVKSSALSDMVLGFGWRMGVVLLLLIGLHSHAAGLESDMRRDAVVQAVERVMPSVVNIGTRTRVQRLTYYYDWWRDTYAPFIKELPPQESAGSGVVIDEDGYILTNAHVVEGADEIWVKISDDSKPNPIRAIPVVIDAQRRDLAVLKLQGQPGEKFKAARFAAPDDLLLGETVIALGNPFGLGGSVSRGILSSKTRRPDTEGEASLDVWDWLQTDAAINPGNSGGPLINLRGDVIGINVAIYKQGQGIGFAIPAKRINETLSEMFSPEGLKSLWFGARLRPGPAPFRVISVQANSPAARAGLRVGDAVVQVNGKAPRSFIACNEMLVAGGAGDVALSVQRGAEVRPVTVRLTPYADVIRQRLGLVVQELTAEQAEATGYQAGDGLVIANVEKGSPAEQVELQRGQLLVAVGAVKTTDIAAAAGALAELKSGEVVELTVLVRRRRGVMVMLAPAKVRVRVR